MKNIKTTKVDCGYCGRSVPEDETEIIGDTEACSACGDLNYYSLMGEYDYSTEEDTED